MYCRWLALVWVLLAMAPALAAERAVEGWGGQAVDMVGCHRGLIDSCTFRGKPGLSQHTGPQTKGGSHEVTIRRCLFDHAEARAVNLGGSTGLRFFRPQGVALG